MKKLLLMAAAGVFSVFAANAQDKVAVVDFLEIAKQIPEAVAFDKEMKALQQRYLDTLGAMQKDLNQQYTDYQKQQSMMAPEMKQVKEQELMQLNQEIKIYEQEKLSGQGELMRKNQEFMVPLREKIVASIAEVAKKEKIKVVLEKSQVLYNDESLDITFTVIDKMKRGAN